MSHLSNFSPLVKSIVLQPLHIFFALREQDLCVHLDEHEVRWNNKFTRGWV